MVGEMAPSYPGCPWKQSLRHRLFIWEVIPGNKCGGQEQWNEGGNATQDWAYGRYMILWGLLRTYEMYLNTNHGQRQNTQDTGSCLWLVKSSSNSNMFCLYMYDCKMVHHEVASEKSGVRRQVDLSLDFLYLELRAVSVAGEKLNTMEIWSGIQSYPT